tara:strand:+ start:500 stop:832 length:333 start_codon:yes stop_codon:yes gene_type:complete
MRQGIKMTWQNELKKARQTKDAFWIDTRLLKEVKEWWIENALSHSSYANDSHPENKDRLNDMKQAYDGILSDDLEEFIRKTFEETIETLVDKMGTDFNKHDELLRLDLEW